MKNAIGISLILLLFTIHTLSQTDVKKNLIQVGRSGYYFGDQNFRFGKSGIGTTNHSPWIYTYLPYLAYERRQFKNFGMRVSIEEYDVSYCKGCPHANPMEVTNRYFYLFQIGVLAHIPIHDRVELMASVQFSRRFNGNEFGIERYIDHGFWEEAIGFGRNINAWGGGIGLETKCKFYKGFSISIKGEFIRFNNKPSNQLGMNGCLGYEF